MRIIYTLLTLIQVTSCLDNFRLRRIFGLSDSNARMEQDGENTAHIVSTNGQATAWINLAGNQITTSQTNALIAIYSGTQRIKNSLRADQISGTTLQHGDHIIVSLTNYKGEAGEQYTGNLLSAIRMYRGERNVKSPSHPVNVYDFIVEDPTVIPSVPVEEGSRTGEAELSRIAERRRARHANVEFKGRGRRNAK